MRHDPYASTEKLKAELILLPTVDLVDVDVRSGALDTLRDQDVVINWLVSCKVMKKLLNVHMSRCPRKSRPGLPAQRYWTAAAHRRTQGR